MKNKDNNKTLYDFNIEDKKSKKISEKLEKKQNSSNHVNDNEIIIGVTMYPQDEKNSKKIKKIPKEKSKNIKSNVEKNQNSIPRKKQEKSYKNINKKRKPRMALKILKWTSIIIVIIVGIIYTMVSPIFNINKISVNGNSTVTTEKIINLSGLTTGENIFRINKNNIKKSIMKNGYIDNVSIKRVLPDEIEITVEERTSTYIIEYGDGYAYINNQGYFLEISKEKKNLPTIIGISTPNNEIIEASRLNNDDLNKLNIVLKIFDSAEVNNINTLLTKVDISDNNEYKIYFESENKIAYLGDCSNLETRMLYVSAILKNEQSKSGEIFVDMDLNKSNPFFRESIK